MIGTRNAHTKRNNHTSNLSLDFVMNAWSHTYHYIVLGTQPINQDKGKSPLNVVQVIPLGAKDEMIVPIQVVTRAQAKENPELQPKESEQVPAKK